MPEPALLSAKEAAARLGLKPTDHRTLPALRAAYQERGVVLAVRLGSQRRWWYYRRQIERVAEGGLVAGQNHGEAK